MDANPLSKSLSIKQVADTLGVSDQYVRKQILSGKLPGYQIARKYRVAESDLAAFIVASKAA